VSDALTCTGKGGTITCSIAAAKAGQPATGTCSGASKDIQCTGSVGAVKCTGVTAAERFTCKATSKRVVGLSTTAGAQLACVGKSTGALTCTAVQSGKKTCDFHAGATLTGADSPLAGFLSSLTIPAGTKTVATDGEAPLTVKCPKGAGTTCTGTLLLTTGALGEQLPFSVFAGKQAVLSIAMGKLVRQTLSGTDGNGAAAGVTTSVYAVALSSAESGSKAFAALVAAAQQYGAETPAAGISADYLTACGFTLIKVKPPASTTITGGWNRVSNKPGSAPTTLIPGT
jgi:hypothetical protein